MNTEAVVTNMNGYFLKCPKELRDTISRFKIVDRISSNGHIHLHLQNNNDLYRFAKAVVDMYLMITKDDLRYREMLMIRFIGSDDYRILISFTRNQITVESYGPSYYESDSNGVVPIYEYHDGSDGDQFNDIMASITFPMN